MQNALKREHEFCSVHLLVYSIAVVMYPSQRAYNPLAFKIFWRPFVRVFQVFCVSHFSIYRSNYKIRNVLYFIVFCTLHISVLLYALKDVHYLGNNKYKKSPLMYYVSLLSIINDLIEHVVAHFESFFVRKQEEEIYRRLDMINHIFATKLNYVVDLDEVRKTHIRDTVVFFVLSAIIATGLSFFTLPNDGYRMSLFLMSRIISVTIIRVRRCQVAIIINYTSSILMDLQILLKRQQKNYSQISNESSNFEEISLNCRENLLYIRDIYSNVWLIKNLISSCFGWSFITFLMDFCFDFINSSYWAFIVINTMFFR